MTFPDSNVWLSLAQSEHSSHAAAHAWLRAQSGDILLCRVIQQTVLRLLTTAAFAAPYGLPPLSNQEAWGWWDRLLTDKRLTLAAEPPGLEATWRKLTSRRTASPKLWMDAYLAAFAISGGHQLITFDAAFKQFKGLDALILVA